MIREKRTKASALQGHLMQLNTHLFNHHNEIKLLNYLQLPVILQKQSNITEVIK